MANDVEATEVVETGEFFGILPLAVFPAEIEAELVPWLVVVLVLLLLVFFNLAEFAKLVSAGTLAIQLALLSKSVDNDVAIFVGVSEVPEVTGEEDIDVV